MVALSWPIHVLEWSLKTIGRRYTSLDRMSQLTIATATLKYRLQLPQLKSKVQLTTSTSTPRWEALIRLPGTSTSSFARNGDRRGRHSYPVMIRHFFW